MEEVVAEAAGPVDRDADEAEKRTAKRPRSRRKKSLTISTNRHPIVA
jgi:hypothetical protein